MSTTRRIVPREDGGGGLGTALRRWGPSYFTEIHADNLGAVLPDATEEVKGVAELATASEVNVGTDTERIVTPAGLHQRQATESMTGLVELATSGETIAGTDAVRSVTPAGLASVTANLEPTLSNPDTDGHVLASTIAGVRSWVDKEPVITKNTAFNKDFATTHQATTGTATDVVMNPATTLASIEANSADDAPLPIGLPDWPVTLAYTDGDLTSAIYANDTERYRQTLAYTSGDLTSVVYAYSSDSGTNYTNIGTEALVYTDGTLTSTTWTPA